MNKTLLAIMTAFAAVSTSPCSYTRPKALVYRGPAACDGCAESVAELLESSPWEFNVSYVGPNEAIDVNEHSLKDVQVYAQPGGDDLGPAWKHVKGYKKPLSDFVSSGGHYLGFCLGAYLAGSDPGYELLPQGIDTDSERTQLNAQVTSEEDTVIQVDWTFSSGKTAKGRWLYFQDGAVITGFDDKPANATRGRILAKYSKNGDVAASVTGYGKGWVGLVGPHPEATQDWYASYNFTNPDGIKFDIGYDFIAATLNGGKLDGSRIA